MTYPIGHTCHFPDCSRTTRGFRGYCRFYCGQVYCEEHRDLPHHRCKDFMYNAERRRTEGTEVRMAREVREWIRLHTSLNKELIRAQASALRPGHDCTVDMPDGTNLQDLDEVKQRERYDRFVKQRLGGLLGQTNEHYLLTFDDGVKWVMRCRRLRDDRGDEAIVKLVMDSEVATMEFLREQGVPVPRVYRPPDLSLVYHAYDETSSTSSSINNLYFFMDWVQGRPFPISSLPIQTKLVDQLTAEGRLTGKLVDTFARSYARGMMKLSEIKFDSIGSIYPPSGAEEQPIIGGLISSIVGFPEPPYFHGPFRTARDRWLAAINHHLDLILRHGQFGKDGPFCYLTYLDLRDIVEQCEELKKETKEFYMYHIDTKGHQFMTMDTGEIISWLDWEWAIVTTKEEAFASPHVFGGRQFRMELTPWELRLMVIYEELGRPDLAECVRGGTKYHWLTMLCYPSSGLMPRFAHHQQLRHLMLGDAEPYLIEDSMMTDWSKELGEKYKNDAGYKELLLRYEGL